MFLDEKPQGEVKLDEVSQLLLGTIRVILERGLNNKNTNFIHDDGSVCIKCAICLANGDSYDRSRPYMTSYDAVTDAAYRRLMAKTPEWPYRWIIGRSQEEVIAKLREVAFSC